MQLFLDDCPHRTRVFMDVVVLTCDCGFKSYIEGRDLHQAANGSLGPICCPKCWKRLNEKIKIESQMEKKS